MSEVDPRSLPPATLVDEGIDRGSGATATGARRVASMVGTALPGLVALGLVILGWQLIALHNGDVLPRIGAIWQALVSDPGPRTYSDNALTTLEETAVGLGSSFLVAFFLAVVMVHVRVVERAVMPLAVILNVTPVVSLAPGLAIALGFGLAPRFLVTGIIVFFPLLVNSLVGLRSVDRDALEFLLSLDANRREILVRLRLPSSLPFLFAAARICFPLAIVGAVVAEFSTAGQNVGLGSLIYESANLSAWPTMYAAIFCLALLGLALTVVVVLAERRLVSWHPSRRGL